jgi:thioredoxin 1
MSFFVIAVIVVVGLLALIVIGPRLLMARKTAKLKGQPAPTPHKPSAKRIKSGARTILYFYTPSCSVCRTQTPIIAKAQKRYPDALVMFDASVQREAARAYGVMGVPFLAFIEEGKLVSAKAGLQREAAISGFLSGGAQGA